MYSASGSTYPFIVCWAASFGIESESMRTATEAKRWRVWMKCCVRAPRRGKPRPQAILRETTLARPAKRLLPRRTTIAARLSRKERRVHRLTEFDLDVPGTEGSDPHSRGLSNQAIDHMVSLIGAVYEAVGKDTDIAVDCHWRYNPSDVVKVAHELEPFRLLWLEDPVPPSNTSGLKEVSSKVRVPIATGENLFLFEGFEKIIAQHALSIATPDLQKVGGLAVAQSIAQFADVHSMPVAPHNISSPGRHTGFGSLLCGDTELSSLESFHASDVPLLE